MLKRCFVHSAIKSTRGYCMHFIQSRQGSVLPLVASSMIVLVGATGLAIDASRYALMTSSLQRSVDAGGLSAVAKLSTSAIDDEVRKFTAANFANGYVDARIDSLTTALSADNKTLSVSAVASAPTTFMSIFGIKTMSARVESQIERSIGGLELVLVLDNTGSMAGSGLTALKTAAKSLLNILFGDKPTSSKLYVGIVPFSQTVNIGTVHADWLQSGSIKALDWGTTSWGGCVEARDGYDVSDDVPATKTFRPYYWETGSNNDWITTTKKNGKTTISYKSGLGSSLGPNKSCPSEVTRMTTVKKTLVSAIDGMNAVGNTHVNFGAVWGWRMLSPKWNGLWGGEMDSLGLPLPYYTKSMSKVAVIMTDGENTMSSSVYTSYSWLSDKKLGTNDANKAVAELDSRLTKICKAMKNAGIIVYTIAFNKPGNNVQALLRDCATQPAFYFNSPSTADLQSAFKEIGDSLSNLRVSR